MAITDGQLNPMNLTIVNVTSPSQMHTMGSIGVKFNGSEYSTSEQSVSVIVQDGYADLVVVQNFIGTNQIDPSARSLITDPSIAAGDLNIALCNYYFQTPEGKAELMTGYAQKYVTNNICLAYGVGVNMYRFQLVNGEYELSEQWSNSEVSATTAIPLQTKDSIWVYGTASEEERGSLRLISLSRSTGEVKTSSGMPKTDNDLYAVALNNIAYAGIGLYDESHIVFGLTRGAAVATPGSCPEYKDPIEFDPVFFGAVLTQFMPLDRVLPEFCQSEYAVNLTEACQNAANLFIIDHAPASSSYLGLIIILFHMI